MPLILLSLILLFDHTELISYRLRPNVGEEGCFLKDEKLTQFLYLYLPLLILICTNIFFFIVTAIRFSRSVQTKILTMNDNSACQSKQDNDRYRFGLYLRMFFIMGITWSLEIISWLLADPKTASLPWEVYLLDVTNCLAGITIFYLFVCSGRVIKLLLKRFSINRKENTSQTDSSVHTVSRPIPCKRVIEVIVSHECV
ncbi:probable G-protein coupled receptor Mth-like 3 [Anopheles albimanus]|uniref:probable G-protein coupled receptor Mth-like 3 n=1 Tax=Anopheles albimanus TaxID=7167 RepID=UPI00163FD18C|nr:probable G-protein coupled receptor Mth-like 3 [Anopheles albimanus]